MHRVLLLTAKEGETNAARLQLIGPIRFEHTRLGNRYNLWHLKSLADPTQAVPDIEIALYETGRGQKAAIMYTTQIVESFQPHLVIYLGCAGGDPSETEIGDVLIATEIWNYEPASVGDPGCIRPKGHPLEPDRVVLDECRGINEFGSWRGRIPGGPKNSVHVHFKPAASGEKVVKSTSADVWTLIKERLSDEIAACETEGHGFLSALAPFKTYGVMIRGISDTLDNKDQFGKEVDDGNQHNATAHAAAFAAQLIEEADFEALERVKRRPEPKNSPTSETVSIEVRAKTSDVGDIIKRLIDILDADHFVVRRVEEGSVIIYGGTGAKPAALAKALFDGQLLKPLLRYEVDRCFSSVRDTGDVDFDRWLANLRRGDVAPSPDEYRLEGNERWIKHAQKLAIQLKKSRHDAPGPPRVVGTWALYEFIDDAPFTKRNLALASGVSESTIRKALNETPILRTTAARIHVGLKTISEDPVDKFERYFEVWE